MRRYSNVLILVVMMSIPTLALAQPHVDASVSIRDACNTALPTGLPTEAINHLRAGSNTVVSIPNVTCIAVLFEERYGGSLDRVVVFRAARDRSYFVAGTFRIGSRTDRPRYTFGPTSITQAVWAPGVGVDAVRWEFDVPEFRIDEGQKMTLRRVDSILSGSSSTQEIRTVREFPIEADGAIVDRLFLIVDDQWTSLSPDARHRRWLLYSERANAVIHKFLTQFTPGHAGPISLRHVAQVVYFKGDKVDLTINAEQLQEVLEFATGFVAVEP
ncbi:MAG: hypothetical protein HKM95_02060 [Inquilinus sp.]|nr:hypothetical protein [Inquilinus sp.]